MSCREYGATGGLSASACAACPDHVTRMSILARSHAPLQEVMVDAIEGAASSWGVPDIFIGVVVIPIVGNAAEHAAAIIFSLKNKMDIALGIAIGSATQVRVRCCDDWLQSPHPSAVQTYKQGLWPALVLDC